MENQQQGQSGQHDAHQQGPQEELMPALTDDDDDEAMSQEVTVDAARIRQKLGTDGADILVGTSGREWLVGGKGSDTYLIDDEDTFVHEKQDEGWDTVRASVNFKLSKHVERLELMGDADIFGAGNFGNDRLIGNAGNNRLNGFKGNDSIDGGAGDDTLDGNRGNDRLVGGPGNDRLDGGFGNDVLIGGSGNDTYELRRAMGQDYIYDEDPTPDNVDTIRATTALQPDDLEVMRDGDDLLLRIRHTTSGVRVGNWFKAQQFRVEQVVFDDGTGWDVAALAARAAQHEADASGLRFGKGWGATIAGQQEAGAQGLADPSGLRRSRDSIFSYGTPSLDTVTMQRGGAIDMNAPAPLWTMSVDMIKVDAGIDPADLRMMRDHDDLILLATGGVPGFLRVRRGFDRARVEFADGTVWTNQKIREDLQPELDDGYFVQRGIFEQVISRSAFYGYDDTPDVLEGSRAGDWMFGFDGDDILNGHEGRDNMYGGPGRDRMAGGMHADIMHGGAGDDVLDGGKGADYIDGGAGDDMLIGGGGNDVIEGGSGDDRIDGGGGNDVLYGGPGNDLMRGGTGNDLLYGGAGGDTYYLEMGMGLDIVGEATGQERGGNVIEVTEELQPGDLILVRDGRDLRISGDDFQNRLTLTDLFDGGQACIDAVHFGDGSRWSFQELERRSIATTATAGDDVLHGMGAAQWWAGDVRQVDIHDVLHGLAGADRLSGYAGNDLLDGGAGDDLVTGGRGCDLMAGGKGRDRLVRGVQSDVIVFNRGDGHDTIAFDGQPAEPPVGGALVDSVDTTRRGPTLSLGGVRSDQLALRKSGADLVLELGAGDSISFENWYADTAQVAGTQLQLVLDSTDDYRADADDIARRHKVAVFDFNSMVEQYGRACDALPGLDLWSVAAALTHHHQRGSDTMAIGGELAYHYAHHGNWTSLGMAGLSTALVTPLFGNGDEAIARASTAMPAG
jgi:Ca2+-binding RTX toxin-like protein